MPMRRATFREFPSSPTIRDMLIALTKIETPVPCAIVRTSKPTLLRFRSPHTSLMPWVAGDIHRLGTVFLWNTDCVEDLKAAHDSLVESVRAHGLLAIKQAAELYVAHTAFGMVALSRLLDLTTLSMVKRVL